MKILTIGGATQDVFIHYKKTEVVEFKSEDKHRSCLLLEEGTKIEITNLHYATGGGATNSAVTFSRLQNQVTTICKIGSDYQGTFILDTLKNESIDHSYISQDPILSTGISFIIPSLSGDRTILAYRGANTALQEKDIPAHLYDTSDVVYITSLSGEASSLLLPITQQAHAKNILVANNPGKSQLEAGAETLCQALPYIDILILNAKEANIFMLSLLQTEQKLEKFMQQKPKKNEYVPTLLNPIMYKNICFNLVDFCKLVSSYGPKIVVVTNGKEGVYIAHENTMYFHESIEIEITNTVGAGDAFGSCFVASLAMRHSIEESLVRGILNATSVISYLNAKEGILTKKQLDKRYKEIGLDSIQTFAIK